MLYSIIPMTPELAQEIITWAYDPPYNLYDLSSEYLPGLLNPDYCYRVVTSEGGDLVGYCCFGRDAQVPGGDYNVGEPDVLDIGVGMSPDLTGQGLGNGFISAIEDYAIKTFSPKILRVSVAAFNERSLNVFRSCGFLETTQFNRELIKIKFIQLEKSVRNEKNG
jgi:ribosomal-protein-alanine N-acetyltransferase